MSCSCDYLVAAAEHVLPHDLRRNVRVAWLGEVAVRCSANEAAFALRIEPSCRFTIWNYRGEWGALSLIPPRCTLLLLLLPAATTTLSASTLIATATSVVTMIAIAAVLSLIALLLTTALSARLWVVLLLLLLLL